MKESTATIGDGRTDTTGLEVNAFRAVGRKSIKDKDVSMMGSIRLTFALWELLK